MACAKLVVFANAVEDNPFMAGAFHGVGEGDAAIKAMRALNDRIQDETISGQIDRLEEVSGKIFDYVKAHPEKLPQIRKFMSYYLPTTLKLLRSYDELSRQGVSGQNITGTMEKVEGMMATIVLAFDRRRRRAPGGPGKPGGRPPAGVGYPQCRGRADTAAPGGGQRGRRERHHAGAVRTMCIIL